MDKVEKETVFDMLENVEFYDNMHKIGLKAARMRDVSYDIPKAIAKIRNPPLPAIEKIDESDDLQGEGVKIIIPSNIIDIYTRLEILLGLKLSRHTDTLTEASILIDDLHKGGEIENKQQYRNALDKFNTH